MSYRKMTVNDKRYEYVIGKVNTKVKGIGLFPNSQIGNLVAGTQDNYVVTPRNVRAAILGEPVPAFGCESHDTVPTTVLAVNPYHGEIYGKTRYMPNCSTCLTMLADDI